MSEWIDFRTLRRDLNFEKVLTSYGIRLNIRDTPKGRQHSGPCPLESCGETSKANFSANMDEGIWRCFGCGSHGNSLDLVILLEGLDPSKGADVRKGALLAQEKFLGKGVGKPKAVAPQAEKKEAAPAPPRENAKTLINEPLDFTLKSLDPSHGWLKAHGLTPDTVEHFGLGASSRGGLKGRIAIPLHDAATGKLIGYAGRIMDKSRATEKDPLYLFPEPRIRNGIRHVFEPGRVLYNSHAIKAPVNRLLVVSDIEAVWWLWQQGYGHVVSTMKQDCEDAQLQRALSLLKPDGVLAVLAREDEQGSRFARKVMEVGATTCAVRWHATAHEPVSLDAIALQSLLGLAETSVP
jgi:hypothetical protein